MDKLYTSNTEDKRLNIEEPNLIMGRHVLPQQIWRDGALIPDYEIGRASCRERV